MAKIKRLRPMFGHPLLSKHGKKFVKDRRKKVQVGVAIELKKLTAAIYYDIDIHKLVNEFISDKKLNIHGLSGDARYPIHSTKRDIVLLKKDVHEKLKKLGLNPTKVVNKALEKSFLKTRKNG